MKSSVNEENIDKLVFYWDPKSFSSSNSALPNNLNYNKKSSIDEYLKFLEDMNSHHYRKHKKIVAYKNIFTLT